MFVLVFVAIWAGLAGLLALIIYGLGAAIKRQAQKPIKRYFAPVPRPGSYSFATNEGNITDILENVVGWNLKLENNGRRLFYPEKHTRDFWEKHLGVRWIGLFPTINIFKDREWSELQEKKVTENGKELVRYQIETRKETFTDSFFQFSHPVRTDAIEIQGNIQVAVTMLITVLNLDPERAEFLNKDPSILLAAITQSTVRSYICDMQVDDVKRMTGTATNGQNQGLWDAIKQLNGLEMNAEGTPLYKTEDPLGVFGKLGKYIVRGEIVQVDAVGEAAKAIEAEKIAELQGNAKITEAEKKGDAIMALAQREAAALELKRKARMDWVRDTISDPSGGPGPQVAEVLVAEQMASPDSKVTTWVKGSGSFMAIPPAKE